MELDTIKYKYTANLLKFFIGEYVEGRLKSVEAIINEVAYINPSVSILYTFHESIWLPDRPEDRDNLILFYIKIHPDSCATCYLYLNRGANQETMPVHPAYYSRKVIPNQNIVRGVLTHKENTYFEKYVICQKYIQVLKKSLDGKDLIILQQKKAISRLKKRIEDSK